MVQTTALIPCFCILIVLCQSSYWIVAFTTSISFAGVRRAAVISLKSSKKNPESDDGNTDDFSAWMEGLGQWPMTSSEKEPSSFTTSASNPFVNFMQLLEVVNKSNKSNSTNIFQLADQLFQNVVKSDGDASSFNETATMSATVQDFLSSTSGTNGNDDELDWLTSLPSALLDAGSDSNNAGASRLSTTQSKSTSSNNTSWFQEATSRMEFLVQEAASLSSNAPSVLPELMERTQQWLGFLNTQNRTKEDLPPIWNEVDVSSVVETAEALPLSKPQRRVLRETASYASVFMATSNALFTAGYVDEGDAARQQNGEISEEVRPLLAEFPTAQPIPTQDITKAITIGAEMGLLAGAIYEDTVKRCQSLGHSIVARGTSADVAWLVTDSINTHDNDGKPTMIRTITSRGFDASDDTVDREHLLNVICTPEPEKIIADDAENGNNLIKQLKFHAGLLSTARAIYQDVLKYIDWTVPDQRIVFNGHSIGGSLSVLLMFLLTLDRGVDFVRDKVLRVYTHGSPPMVAMPNSFPGVSDDMECPILKAFNLPSDLVYGYVQPYDPIVRFMTKYDPLYPLVDDLGSDEKTLYVSGPRRSLRPIARYIFNQWPGWPKFRANWKKTNVSLQSVGMQHLLLPDPQRYLTDRFVSPNVGVPPTEHVVRISSSELLPALNATFPLDTFQISLIPQAVRSFVHHFYPAYDTTIANYATKLEKKRKSSRRNSSSEKPRVDPIWMSEPILP